MMLGIGSTRFTWAYLSTHVNSSADALSRGEGPASCSNIVDLHPAIVFHVFLCGAGDLSPDPAGRAMRGLLRKSCASQGVLTQLFAAAVQR